MGLSELLAAATPGPWHVCVNDLIGGYMVANVDKPAHAQHPDSGDRAVAEMCTRADARLVAIAPEMAHLLIDTIDTLRPLAGRPDPLTEKINALLARFEQLDSRASAGGGVA